MKINYNYIVHKQKNPSIRWVFIVAVTGFEPATSGL